MLPPGPTAWGLFFVSAQTYPRKGRNPSCTSDVKANTGLFIPEDPVISDPTRGQRDGPTKDSDPGDSHSGEGLESVRPRLARTLADSARRSQDKQAEAMTSRIPNETSPDPEPEPTTPPGP
jgi:hypothetical protein